MMDSQARLLKEYRVMRLKAQQEADPDFKLVCNSSIFKWGALIKGPPETPYEGGIFRIAISVPEGYPLYPPRVNFLTDIFHPNVHFTTGRVRLSILNEDVWSPNWTLESVCRAVIALMVSPEIDDHPINVESGNLLANGDVRGHQAMARMYTKLAAI